MTVRYNSHAKQAHKTEELYALYNDLFETKI